MNVAEFRCHGAHLGAVMSELRCWLDRHQAETSLFELVSRRAGTVVLRLQFREPQHAIEFAAVFGGNVLTEPQRAAA